MSTQTAFAFDKAVRRPRARRDDPETSREAARSVKRLTEQQEYILSLVRYWGPSTDEEIWLGHRQWTRDGETVYEISPSGARTRRKELCEMNLVRDSGKRRKTRSGRNAIVWEVV